MVLAPVVLVVSAVEVQTAARAVYCAVTVLALGAAGAVAGQMPAVPSPLTRLARLALPTT